MTSHSYLRKLPQLSFAVFASLPLTLGVVTPSHAAEPTPGVVINEVESNGDDTDWVELFNSTNAPVDLSGYEFRDNEDSESHRYVIPEGSIIEPGGYFIVDQKTAHNDGFDFGLGGNDAARLFTPNGVVYTEYSWTAPAVTTFGRCPNGAGELVETGASSRGKENICSTPEVPVSDAITWPGASTMADLDAVDDSRGDWSGLDYVPSNDGTPGTIWAVQNGEGQLYQLVNKNGTWHVAGGWTLHYTDGSGVVDAEGVTVADDGFVYISTERDNSNKSISRPSLLKFAPVEGNVDSSAPLNAVEEWDLTADFPGLGANAGLEGVTWISDTWLVEKGLTDQKTGKAYDSSTYPGTGLFAVGVEGTAGVYLYSLEKDGTAVQISSFDSGFELVADLEFDAERNQLWVVCDEACNGETATFAPGASGKFERTNLFARPTDTQNYANEGFTVADLSQCINGQVPVYYADDANTDGHSLRQGFLSSECTSAPAQPTSEPLATSSAVATEAPVVAPTPVPSASSEPGNETTSGVTATVEPSAIVTSAQPSALTTTSEPAAVIAEGGEPGSGKAVSNSYSQEQIAGESQHENLAHTGATSIAVLSGAGLLLLAGGAVLIWRRHFS